MGELAPVVDRIHGNERDFPDAYRVDSAAMLHSHLSTTREPNRVSLSRRGERKSGNTFSGRECNRERIDYDAMKLAKIQVTAFRKARCATFFEFYILPCRASQVFDFI
ncbi:TPA: hypothetical protein QDB43_006230 [Burkholderia vietnamiensis]|nr:hypothetical protein [Burkholderia vietnamiensis]